MYNPFQIALRYLRYRSRAYNGKGHGMHSPFVFRFIREVLNDRRPYPEYKAVESIRQALLKDESVLQVRELGAGSGTTRSNQRSVRSIARAAAKDAKLAQLLFRMARYYQCSRILELGTSLGISSSYLQLARPSAVVTTLEGSPEISERAKQNFATLGIHPDVVEGNFDDTLPLLLAEGNKYDLVFIDGNHRREPTVRYFEDLLPFIHNDSILVFDDIHWSAEMEQAWAEIRAHDAVRCSIDLFYLGIIFFRREFREKQDFVIKF